jgi:hypothetical protein
MAMRSWSLTERGRRYMAHHFQEIYGTLRPEVFDTDLLDETLAYANVGYTRFPGDVPVDRKRHTEPMQWDRLLQDIDHNGTIYHLGQVIETLDRVAPNTASDNILMHLAQWTREGSHAAAMDLLIRASFARRLPWTTTAPAKWWPKAVTQMWRSRAVRSYFIHLPPVFLPRTTRLRWLKSRAHIGDRINFLYYPDAGLEEITVLLRSPLNTLGALSLANHIRHRHDAATIIPEVLPLLIGHTAPELATLGLELLHERTTPHQETLPDRSPPEADSSLAAGRRPQENHIPGRGALGRRA